MSLASGAAIFIVGPTNVNLGADKKCAGSNSYISTYLLQKVSNTSTNSHMSLCIYVKLVVFVSHVLYIKTTIKFFFFWK